MKVMKKIGNVINSFGLQIGLEILTLILILGTVIVAYEDHVEKNKALAKEHWAFYMNRLNNVEQNSYDYEYHTSRNTDNVANLFTTLSGYVMYDGSFWGADYTSFQVSAKDDVYSNGDWIQLESSQIGSHLWNLNGSNKDELISFYRKLIKKGKKYTGENYFLEGANTLYVDEIEVRDKDGEYELVNVTFASLLTDETFTLLGIDQSQEDVFTLKMSEQTGVEDGYNNAVVCFNGRHSFSDDAELYSGGDKGILQITNTYKFSESQSNENDSEVKIKAYVNVKEYTLASKAFKNNVIIIFVVGQLLGILLIYPISYWKRKKKNYKEMRNLFLNGIAHEMKTPAAAIINGVECIGQNVNPEKNDRYMKIVSDEAYHINEQLNSLLTYTRLADATHKVEKRRTDVTELINPVVAHYQMLIEKKAITVEKNLKYGFFLDTNEEMLKLVIDNYVSNAVKNCKKGGKIIITSYPQAITVYNDGPNIKKRNLKKIWEPLFMEDESRKKYDSSTGMGLAICACALQILRLNYGVSNMEGGVEFYFCKKSFWNVVDAVRDFFSGLWKKKCRLFAVLAGVVVLVGIGLVTFGVIDPSLLRFGQKDSGEKIFAIQEENLIALDQVNGKYHNTRVAFTLVSNNKDSLIFDEQSIERSVLYKQILPFYVLKNGMYYLDWKSVDNTQSMKNLRKYMEPKRKKRDDIILPMYEEDVCKLAINKELSGGEVWQATIGDANYYYKELVFDIKCDANEIKRYTRLDSLLLQFENGAYATIQIGNTAFLDNYYSKDSADCRRAYQRFTSDIIPVSYKMLGENQNNHNPKAIAVTVRANDYTVIHSISDRQQNNNTVFRTDKAIVLKHSVAEIDEESIFKEYPQLEETEDTYYWDFSAEYSCIPECKDYDYDEQNRREEICLSARLSEIDGWQTDTLDYQLKKGEECTIIVPIEYHTMALLDKCAFFVNNTPISLDFTYDASVINDELINKMSTYGTNLNALYQ